MAWMPWKREEGRGCYGRDALEGWVGGRDGNGRYGVEEKVKGMEGAESVTNGRYARESYCKVQLLLGQCFELTL